MSASRTSSHLLILNGPFLLCTNLTTLRGNDILSTNSQSAISPKKYRFPQLTNSGKITLMNVSNGSTTIPKAVFPSSHNQVYLLSTVTQLHLEIYSADQTLHRVPFIAHGPGREPGEMQWLAEPRLPDSDVWHFRVMRGNQIYYAPRNGDYYQTSLRRLWLQDGQVFNYPPAAQVSPPQVIKISKFSGSLPPRDLYVYLPRGYREHTARNYPVIYMHDGQNCFEAFVGDSFAGSWRADETADWLISQSCMRECIIVGISNGQQARLSEYLPPYVVYRPPAPSEVRAARRRGKLTPTSMPAVGKAGQTAAYYRYEVASYIRRHYRVLSGREHTATCGSSMGGLFSTYLAWERTDFAKHHAALSPSYWITRNFQGTLEVVERLRTGGRRDIRLWLDSGTLDTPNSGDDGRHDVLAARKALLENGYVEGQDFQYHVAEGATHSEASWATRLPLAFQFLFPIEEEREDRD